MRLVHDNHAMDALNTALGRAIGQLRSSAKISQAQLGDMAGMDQSAISKIERGAQGVSTQTLTAIAEGLGVKVSEIWAVAEGSAPSPVRIAIVPKAPAPASRRGPLSYISRDIDALRYAVGAIISVIVAVRPDVAGKLTEALGKAPPDFLAEEGLLVALREAVEDGARLAKARRRPQTHEGA